MAHLPVQHRRRHTLQNVARAASMAAALLISAGCATAGGGTEKNRLWLSENLAKNFSAEEAPHTIMVKPVAEGVLTSGHGYRLSPTGVPLPRKHKGVDYAAPQGTQVYAAASGVVEKRYLSESYGNYIRIRHNNGFSTAYAHLHTIDSDLKEGSVVTRGQKIATVGSTGRSTGPHLHFEVIHNGKFIDPLFDRLKSTQAQQEREKDAG